MNPIAEITEILNAHTKTMEFVAAALPDEIERFCSMIVDTFKAGNKILIMGNGGSAADSQHFAAEMVGRFLMERKALPAIALTTDTSIITAVGNDYGYDDIFKRQVEALANPGDLVFGISTSGNSPNVLRAIAAAKDIGCKTTALLGRDGGQLAGSVDLAIVVREGGTPRIQEAHLTIIHIVCDLVERMLFAEGGSGG